MSEFAFILILFVLMFQLARISLLRLERTIEGVKTGTEYFLLQFSASLSHTLDNVKWCGCLFCFHFQMPVL